MKCEADVVFLGLRSNTSKKNGKVYHNVDFRSDNRNMSMGTSCPECFTVFQEFQPVHITIDLFSWNNSLVGNIIDVMDVRAKK